MRVASHRAPHFVFVEHELSCPSITRTGAATSSPSSRGRSSRQAQERRPAVARLPPGRPGRRVAAPAEARLRDRLDDRALRTTASCCSTSAAPAARRRSAPVPGMTPAEQAEYLTHFRADSIVRDAELIRRELGVERWSVLGQSFGGFYVVNVPLARAGRPGGGVHHRRAAAARPPRRRRLRARPTARMLERNRRYFERYPQDRDRVRGSSSGSRPRTSACRRRPADRAAVPPARQLARR